MTQHTPGPWRVAFGNRLEIHGPKDEIGWPKSIVWNAGLFTDKESQANAALIAAAPDMLAALEAFVGSRKGDGMGWTLDSLQAMARDAIAKAKGGAA